MAGITDAGDANDVHPACKQAPATRLALANGEKVDYSGPLPDTMKTERNRAMMSFTRAGKGLVAKDGELRDFTIARADKHLVPARAEIQGTRDNGRCFQRTGFASGRRALWLVERAGYESV